jgi:hypothetical protein
MIPGFFYPAAVRRNERLSTLLGILIPNRDAEILESPNRPDDEFRTVVRPQKFVPGIFPVACNLLAGY